MQRQRPGRLVLYRQDLHLGQTDDQLTAMPTVLPTGGSTDSVSANLDPGGPRAPADSLPANLRRAGNLPGTVHRDESMPTVPVVCTIATYDLAAVARSSTYDGQTRPQRGCPASAADDGL